MSRQAKSRRPAPGGNPLGKWLRELRHAKGEPLRVVAAAADIDSTLLSKIELGQRLPTEQQTAAFAVYFGVSAEDMEAKRLAEKFWMENRNNPAAAKAARMIRKAAPAARPKSHATGSEV